MAKRRTGMRKAKNTSSHKTKKRLAIKAAMLEKKAKSRKKNKAQK